MHRPHVRCDRSALRAGRDTHCPWEGTAQPLNAVIRAGAGHKFAELGTRPELLVIGVAATRSDIEILASRNIRKAKIWLAGNTHDDRATADPGQLLEGRSWIMLVFQHLEAADDVKRFCLERNLENARCHELCARIHLLRHLNRMRIEIKPGQLDCRHALHDQVSDKSLTATGVKERRRIEITDFAK